MTLRAPNLVRTLVYLLALAMALWIVLPIYFITIGAVSTRAFPVVILAIPLSVTFIRWGIDDSILGVAIAHTALALPFAVLTTSSVFAGISDELEEAAMTMGCSRIGAVVRVILPLALP